MGKEKQIKLLGPEYLINQLFLNRKNNDEASIREEICIKQLSLINKLGCLTETHLKKIHSFEKQYVEGENILTSENSGS